MLTLSLSIKAFTMSPSKRHSVRLYHLISTSDETFCFVKEHVTSKPFEGNKDSKEEDIISTKRKSYRQKVKDFKTNKSKPEGSRKISRNSENLNVIKKKENQEKRQGWWNQ